MASAHKPLIGADIVREARTWIGTPYRHQASLKGVGCDCLGLIRGVWRAVVGQEPEPLPAYTSDWAEAGGAETLRDAALRHLIPLAIGDIRPGCVILFRWRRNLPAKHAAILATPATIIHAHERIRVCEAALGDAWARRISHAFLFPGVET